MNPTLAACPVSHPNDGPMTIAAQRIQRIYRCLDLMAGILLLAAVGFSVDSYFFRPVRELDRLPGVELYGYPVETPYLSKDVLAIEFVETDVAADSLQAAQQFPHLRTIHFISCTIPNETIAQIKNLPQLEGLYIENCAMDVQQLISQCANLPNLSYLSFVEMEIPPGAFRDLRSSYKLRALCLRQSRIDGHEIRDIAKAPSIQVLTLSKAEISDDGIDAIVKADVFQTLNLDRTELTDSHVSRLCTCRTLHHLDISETKVSKSALVDFERSNSLKSVRAWKSPLGSDFHKRHLSNGCVIRGSVREDRPLKPVGLK